MILNENIAGLMTEIIRIPNKSLKYYSVKSNFSYSYGFKVLKLMSQRKLIKLSKKNGREILVTPTDKLKLIVDLIFKLRKLLK